MNLKRCTLVAGMCLAMASAFAAEVMVAPTLPQKAKADFFERIQTSPDLAEAIKKRGKRVRLMSGRYRMRVPCDNAAPGAFADIGLALGETSLIQFIDCGAALTDEIPNKRDSNLKQTGP